MEIHLRFFATFREVVGQKELTWEVDARTTTVGVVLEDLVSTYPQLEFYTPEGDLRDYLSILKNGRDITFLAQLDTPLGDGDTLSIFPPVAGGSTSTVERTYRGISRRAARQYLEGIGGKTIDDTLVSGSDWQAEIAESVVTVGPSLELTELTIVFEGKEDTLEEIVETFSRKAMRAGG